MEEKALEALHVAADAIRTIHGITSATADNDNDSGEVCFTTASGKTYIFRLIEAEDDPAEICAICGSNYATCPCDKTDVTLTRKVRP
jgi:hypothetical protein